MMRGFPSDVISRVTLVRNVHVPIGLLRPKGWLIRFAHPHLTSKPLASKWIQLLAPLLATP